MKSDQGAGSKGYSDKVRKGPRFVFIVRKSPVGCYKPEYLKLLWATLDNIKEFFD